MRDTSSRGLVAPVPVRFAEGVQRPAGIRKGRLVALVTLGVALVGGVCFEITDMSRNEMSAVQTTATHHPFVGTWVTADDHIRQQLLPDGRYDEARGARESAYTGRYEVHGNQIDYVDDTDFTADGRFAGDVLYHGGYVFYREGSEAHRASRGRS